MNALRALAETWKRFSLRRLGHRVEVAASTRLLRRFSVRFMSPPAQRPYLVIGERCLINAAITFESADGHVQIGDRVYIGDGTNIISRDRVTIGNDVTMAWDITIYDHNSHSLDWQQRARVVDHFYRRYGTSDCFQDIDWTGVASAPIRIQDRAWIGFGAVILKGVTIGEGAIVAAGSIVTKDVDPYTIVAGNPAVVVRQLDRNASAHA